MIKSLDEWPTNWRTIILNKFFHCCEDSEPLIRLPSLGIQQRAWESPGNLTLRASGIWLQDFHRTGGNRDSSLGEHKQNCVHTETKRKGAVTPQEAEPKLLVLEGLLWRCESAGAHYRERWTGGSCLRRSPLVLTLLEVAINLSIEP